MKSGLFKALLKRYEIGHAYKEEQIEKIILLKHYDRYCNDSQQKAHVMNEKTRKFSAISENR